MAKAISIDTIQKINELYAQYGVKARVAEILGISPATVTKYLQKDFCPQAKVETVKFDGVVGELDVEIFRDLMWGDLCMLSEGEKEELKEFQKELSL